MEKVKKGKILVVEDNFMNKVLVREMLIFSGYEVLEAESGKEAVDKVLSDMPDLVLMDINLPEMDGFTAMRIIKENEAAKHIPIVALTASAMKGDEARILSGGFDGYVAKPIELKKLIEALEKKLGQRTSL